MSRTTSLEMVFIRGMLGGGLHKSHRSILGDYLMDFLFGLVIILFGITALLYMIGD